jgi:hypothetical protein
MAKLWYEPIDDLELGLLIQLNSSKYNYTTGISGYGGSFGSLNDYALPWYPVYNSQHPTGYWNPMSGKNPVAYLDKNLSYNLQNKYNDFMKISAEYKMPYIQGLVAKLSLGYNLTKLYLKNWVSEYLNYQGAEGTFDKNTNVTKMSNILLNYNRMFLDDHQINITSGVEWYGSRAYYYDTGYIDVTRDYMIDIEEKRKLGNILDDYNYEHYIRSYITSMHYNYRKKYFVNANFRYDGSSILNKDNRWSSYYGFSPGYLLSEEAFMKKKLPWISTIRIGGSWGKRGNLSSSLFEIINTKYAYSTRNVYSSYNWISTSLYLAGAGNSYIIPEKSEVIELGGALGVINDRIYLEYKVYTDVASDLVISQSNNYWEQYWMNNGEIIKNANEFYISTINLNTSWGFKWITDFNYTWQENVVQGIDDSPLSYIITNYSDASVIIKEGYSIYTFYMPTYAGVDPEHGVEMILELDQEHYEQYGETVSTGNSIPATQTNLNNNKFIQEGKTPFPRYYGGFSSSIGYKWVDVKVYFSFAGGHYHYNYPKQRSTQVGTVDYNLQTGLYENSWKEHGDQAQYPQLTYDYIYYWDMDDNYNWNYQPSGISYNNKSVFYSRFLEKADYIRLKYFEIGFNIPEKLIKKAYLKKMRVYYTGYNLWTKRNDGYSGWDPETGIRALPLMKRHMLGIQITL